MYDRVLKIVIEICQEEAVRYNPNIDLIENDIIDSMAFIELVSALEDEFDVQIQPTQVPSEVWKNIKNISDFIENKIRESKNE